MLKIASLVLIVLGTLLFLVGLFCYFFNIIDMYKGIYSGPIILIIGITLLLYRLNKKEKYPR